MLLKNINDNVKNHIWIKIKYLDNINSFEKSFYTNNTNIDKELHNFYNDIDHHYIKDLAYYMTLTQYTLG